jgi:hypothetical protein
MLHAFSAAIKQDLVNRIESCKEKIILHYQWGRDSGKTTFLIDRLVEQVRVYPYSNFIYGLDHSAHRKWMMERVLAEFRRKEIPIISHDHFKLTLWNGCTVMVLEATEIPLRMQGMRFQEIYLEQFDDFVEPELYHSILDLAEVKAQRLISLI